MENYLTNDQIVNLAPAAGATEPHQDVSDRYSFVQTLRAVDILREVGWMPITAEQAGARKHEREGFQKHVIRFAKEGLDFSGERVDLVLTNSHDRGTAFKMTASVWRKICENGLMVPTPCVNFRHKHIGFDEIDFSKSAIEIAEHAGMIADQVDDFKTIELTPSERGVFAMAAHNLVYDLPEEAPIRPEQLLEERRYDDKGNDLWSVTNKVQENVIKGGVRGQRLNGHGRIRRVTTRPVKSIDRNMKLNKALWILTEEMKKLKS